MPFQPLVSICIPTYNYGHFLPQALDSVFRQDFSDYEIVILDNASTDNTAAVVRGYHDGRIRYFRHETNVGFVNNVNKGLALARGDYIIFLCADDLWYPGMLQKTTAVLRSSNQVVLVHTAEKQIDSQGRVIRLQQGGYAPVCSGREAALAMLCAGWNFSFSSCMMRRDILQKIGGFNPEFGAIADGGVFLRMCLEGDIAYLQEYLVGYRIHGTNLTNEILRNGHYFKEQRKLLTAFMQWQPSGFSTREQSMTRTCLARDIISLLHIIRIEGGRKEVFQCLREAWAIDPLCWLSPILLGRILLSLLLPLAVITWLQQAKSRLSTRQPDHAN